MCYPFADEEQIQHHAEYTQNNDYNYAGKSENEMFRHLRLQKTEGVFISRLKLRNMFVDSPETEN